MSLPNPYLRRLGATPEPRKILDLNSKDFDNTVKHFGQRFFHLGVVSDAGKPHVLKHHLASPASINYIPHPNATATEIIAQQRSLSGKIPPLARGVIIAWAFLNLTVLILSLLGMS